MERVQREKNKELQAHSLRTPTFRDQLEGKPERARRKSRKVLYFGSQETLFKKEG